ncbi:MAG: hypothetical protein ACE3L7_07430 [Candidatus Pristimantibacillus sp.]
MSNPPKSLFTGIREGNIAYMENYQPKRTTTNRIGRQDYGKINKQTTAQSELSLSEAQIASAAEGGSDNMDDSMNRLLDRIDKDSREREERYHNDAREREARYHTEMLEQDRRYRTDAKEREERLIKLVGELKSDLKSGIKDLKSDLQGGISELKIDLKSEMLELRTEMKSTSKDTRMIAITTIIGVSAMVIGALVALFIVLYQNNS